MIFPNDHRPAYVHLIADGEAVFILHCPEGPPELREVYGFNRSEVNRIEAALADRVRPLCAKWREVRGRY